MSSPTQIPTTLTGSLARPDELLPFLRAREDGQPYDETAFQDCLDTSVRDVVARQAQVGLDIVSDGEFPKPGSWARYIQDRLDGFEYRPTSGERLAELRVEGADRRAFPEFYAEYDKTQGYSPKPGDWTCVGPIVYRGQSTLRQDIDRLVAALAEVGGLDGFMPAVGPSSALGARGARAANEYYATDEEFMVAFAEAMREEYRAIVDAGLTLQVDDPILTNRFEFMGAPEDRTEYRRWFAKQAEYVNHALAGLPRERTRYHLCWGSWHGPHTADVPLADIIDLLLRIDVGAYVIEGANPRHEHEWRVWQQTGLPEGRQLVAGVIAHTTTTVEHPQVVADRLLRLAEFLEPSQLIAGTDCGFAQGPFVRRLHPSVVWAKLASLAEGARLASETLANRARRQCPSPGMVG
jgi:5-methyltetrahydropteroyltriglutamate--homocysteine methyltransferase